MKKKIFMNISLLATTAVLLVSILLIRIFYNFNILEQKKFLKDHSHTIANSLEIMDFKNIEEIANIENPNFRTTIIDNTGKVIMDSSINSIELENHLNRSEIQEAFNNGMGESIRYSTTLGKNTYYYAVLLSNNSVLRISIQTDNILSVFISTLPAVLFIIFSVLLISFFISSILIKNIFIPLEETASNIDNILSGEDYNKFEIYDELIPFIKILANQREEIDAHIKVLKEKADTIEVITSNMKEGLILVNNDKTILSANLSGIINLGGSDKLSYCGEDFIKLCRNIEVNQAIKDAIYLAKSTDIITKFSDKYLNLLINPVKSNDNVLGAVILVVDSTEKYKLDLIRREFSSNVSHELKSPLTTINGYAEIIQTGMAKDEDISRFASIIRSEGLRLLDIIDSIIRLSKIEEKQTKEFSSIDVYTITKSVVGRLSIEAEKKNINLNIIGGKTIIKGNGTMIEELLFNLIYNSIKYTNSFGKVSIEIFKNEDFCFLKVSDTGIGIPIEDQDRIFERFYIVDKSRAKKTQSIGLGLSIVKHIVEYHNGSISLKSIENVGTEIIVKIPIT